MIVIEYNEIFHLKRQLKFCEICFSRPEQKRKEKEKSIWTSYLRSEAVDKLRDSALTLTLKRGARDRRGSREGQVLTKWSGLDRKERLMSDHGSKPILGVSLSSVLWVTTRSLHHNWITRSALSSGPLQSSTQTTLNSICESNATRNYPFNFQYIRQPANSLNR